MNTSYYNPIEFGDNGLFHGVYYGQNERVEEINHRLQDRYFPDTKLPPNYDFRPTTTKFCLFPAVDMRTYNTKFSQELEPDYTGTKYVCSPSTQRGPPVTMIAQIDKETDLDGRGRKTYESTYIPSTNSDLYRVVLGGNPSRPCAASENGIAPYPDLFQQTKYENTLPDYLAKQSISTQFQNANPFNNSTRAKLC
jgi:hypothetical protein